MAARDQTTVGGYRRQMVEGLFGGMLSARLDEIAAEARRAVPQRPKPAADCWSAPKRRPRSTPSSRRAASNAALSALFTEIDRVARFGFTATELNRQRLNLQRLLENAVVEKDKSPSAPLADEFVRNFIHGEPIPGIVNEFG